MTVRTRQIHAGLTDSDVTIGSRRYSSMNCYQSIADRRSINFTPRVHSVRTANPQSSGRPQPRVGPSLCGPDGLLVRPLVGQLISCRCAGIMQLTARFIPSLHSCSNPAQSNDVPYTSCRTGAELNVGPIFLTRPDPTLGLRDQPDPRLKRNSGLDPV